LFEDFIGGGYTSARPAVEGDGGSFGDGDFDVVEHLSGVHFDYEQSGCGLWELLGGVSDLFCGEWPEGDGSDPAGFYSDLSGLLNGGFNDSGGDAEGDEDDLCIPEVVCLAADFVLPNFLVFGLEFEVVFFECAFFEPERADDVLGSVLCAGERPVLGRQCGSRFFFEYDGFHHLPEDAVGEDDDGHSVEVGEVKGQGHRIGEFLDAGGCENDGSVVAVSTAACGLEVVALRGGDISESRAASHYVDDDGGQFGTGKVAEAFLHQADTRA